MSTQSTPKTYVRATTPPTPAAFRQEARPRPVARASGAQGAPIVARPTQGPSPAVVAALPVGKPPEPRTPAPAAAPVPKADVWLDPVQRLRDRKVRVEKLFGGEIVGTLLEVTKPELVLRGEDGAEKIVWKHASATVEVLP